ncbi:MAG: hypothetical protein HRT90_05695 [Candidatus Margulisbacteria bacterium]|nr:hypothetical protein [Candidatus Margulisiibacteriota bacterium]
MNLIASPYLSFKKLNYYLVGKIFLLLSAIYLCYFWTGLSLFFLPSELSFSDYLFGVGVAAFVNIGIIVPLISPSNNMKWVVIPLQILGIVIYSDFLDGSAWMLGFLGIIANIIGINIVIWKSKRRM